MIDKVIIAEDHEFANLSVQKTMEDLIEKMNLFLDLFSDQPQRMAHS
jgi:hypothetical protein